MLFILCSCVVLLIIYVQESGQIQLLCTDGVMIYVYPDLLLVANHAVCHWLGVFHL